MAPQKHMEALKFKYNFGFFIITNIYLDFNNERDNSSSQKTTFSAKPLPRKGITVMGKLCFAFCWQ